MQINTSLNCYFNIHAKHFLQLMQKVVLFILVKMVLKRFNVICHTFQDNFPLLFIFATSYLQCFDSYDLQKVPVSRVDDNRLTKIFRDSTPVEQREQGRLPRRWTERQMSTYMEAPKCLRRRTKKNRLLATDKRRRRIIKLCSTG